MGTKTFFAGPIGSRIRCEYFQIRLNILLVTADLHDQNGHFKWNIPELNIKNTFFIEKLIYLYEFQIVDRG